MNKFGRRKIALALACASILSGRTQAMNTKPQSRQTLAQVGRSKSMSNLTKWLIAAGAVLGVTELVNESLGAFTDADTWYKGRISIVNGIRHLFKKQVIPEESQALVDNVLDVINIFEAGDSIKKKFENNQDIKDGKVEIKDKIIEYRKSKGEFDRISNIKAFECDYDLPEFGLPGTDEEKIENSRKYCIAARLGRVRQFLNEVKKGKIPTKIKDIKFQSNSIRLNYRDDGLVNHNDYVVFKVESPGSLCVNCLRGGLKFECTLNKPVGIPN